MANTKHSTCPFSSYFQHSQRFDVLAPHNIQLVCAANGRRRRKYPPFFSDALYLFIGLLVVLPQELMGIRTTSAKRLRVCGLYDSIYVRVRLFSSFSLLSHRTCRLIAKIPPTVFPSRSLAVTRTCAIPNCWPNECWLLHQDSFRGAPDPGGHIIVCYSYGQIQYA